MTKTICIANQKGGVGKTTTTINFAAALIRKDYKVLIIDADAQGNCGLALGARDNLSTGLGLPELIDEMTIGKGNLKEIPRDKIIKSFHGIDIITSNIKLSRSERNMDSSINKEFVLKEIIDYFKVGYDYVLIDTEPHLGTMLVNALVASDSVIIPTEPDYLSVEGLNILLEDLAKVKKYLNHDLVIEGILITKVLSSSKEANKYINGIRKAFENRIHVFEVFIPISEKVKVAIRKAEDLYDFSPRSFATKAYMKLVEEIENGK